MTDTTSRSYSSIKEISRNEHKQIKSIDYNIILKPPDPLVQRQFIPLNPPKFPKDYEFINLNFPTQFKTEVEEEFTLVPKEKIEAPTKDIVIDIYINTMKMLQRLVFSKEKLDSDGKVSVENIVNLREYEQKQKKKKKKRNKCKDNKDSQMNYEHDFRENLMKLNIAPENILSFESRFESGNLQLAYLTDSLAEENNTSNIEKYELFLHNDTNTTGYTQWFYFRVTNTNKDKRVNLAIMNLLRKRTKYSNGIKIWCYSKKKFDQENIGWHHTSENVKYYKNYLYRLNKGKRQYYYTLEWDYTFPYDDDEVYFANCIPYTYTDLLKELNEYTKYENIKYPFFHRKTLCSTLSGNDVDYFTINNSDTKNFEEENNGKNGIVLIARQHPSETVGSWTIKGAIELLMGESDEAKYLRDNFIFKIIPMINVDGVILGNTRTSLAGCDLNRRWMRPNEFLHPEIFRAKESIKDFNEKHKVECVVDFHGHFGAFNSFFYANHTEEDFASCRYFPFVCAKKSEIIQFEKSGFKMPKYKKGTGRINLFKEFNIENVVTLETSYFGCTSGSYSNQYFTIKTLKEIGKDICLGILLNHYHCNIKLGIANNLNSYPNIQKKIEKEHELITKDFDNYIESSKQKPQFLKEKEKSDEEGDTKDSKEKIEENTEEEEENDEDEISESESEPSEDNFDDEKIKSLLPNRVKKYRMKRKKKQKFLRLSIGKKEPAKQQVLKANQTTVSLPRLPEKKINVLNSTEKTITTQKSEIVPRTLIKGKASTSLIININYNNNIKIINNTKMKTKKKMKEMQNYLIKRKICLLWN